MQSGCPEEHSEKKKIFYFESEEVYMFCRNNFDFEPKVFRFLAKIFQRGCFNCILRVQEESLKKKNWKKIFHFGKLVTNFWTFNKNFSAVLSKSNCTFPEEHLRVLLEKVTLLFISFLIWAKNYPTSAKKFPAGLSKLHLTSQEERFDILHEKKTTLFITSGLQPH